MYEREVGNNIAKFRKACGMTQDQLAEALAVSPQAVSKWENDVSYPDIELLPKLAEIFGVSIDDLFSKGGEPETKFLPPEERKDPDSMLLKVNVLSSDGDKVKLNLPLALARLFLSSIEGNENFNINGLDLTTVDWEQILQLIDQGVVGKLVEVESAEGDLVEIYVE